MRVQLFIMWVWVDYREMVLKWTESKYCFTLGCFHESPEVGCSKSNHSTQPPHQYMFNKRVNKYL